MSDEALIADIQSKIEREKRLIDGFTRMRQSAVNPAVQANTDVQIRDSRRNIQYFESKLNELQIRKSMSGMSMSSDSSNRTSAPGYPGGLPYESQEVGGERADYGDGGYSTSTNTASGPPRAPFAPGGPGSGPANKSRPNYSRLGKA